MAPEVSKIKSLSGEQRSPKPGVLTFYPTLQFRANEAKGRVAIDAVVKSLNFWTVSQRESEDAGVLVNSKIRKHT